jgi:ABC-2 type transport system ATP-binding protein
MSDTSATAPMIVAEHLTKVYGEVKALDDVSFSIAGGQIVAFLGPNGAGKTTTMKILTGFLAPTSGTARVAGFDVAVDRLRAAERLGYLPENGPLYQDMTPASLLRFFGDMRGMDPARRDQRIQAVSKLCALGSVLDKPIYKLSKGYRQRCGMAQALLHEPDVLIMDEPTSGLDPNQIREVRGTIRELGKSRTILLSTHILQEVEAVADRVLFIHAGRIVFDGTPKEMNAKGASLDAVFHQLTGAAP